MPAMSVTRDHGPPDSSSNEALPKARFGMLKAKRFVVVSCLLLTGVGAFTLAQNRASQHEGAKPYTPTRLEWLALEMNAESRRSVTAENPFTLEFVAISDEDTIVIYVQYVPSVNREILNRAVDSARKIVAIRAEGLGWASWLKVKEKIDMLQG
jgi:hypothetical protein